jgi:hypothetical protein
VGEMGQKRKGGMKKACVFLEGSKKKLESKNVFLLWLSLKKTRKKRKDANVFLFLLRKKTIFCFFGDRKTRKTEFALEKKKNDFFEMFVSIHVVQHSKTKRNLS